MQQPLFPIFLRSTIAPEQVVVQQVAQVRSTIPNHLHTIQADWGMGTIQERVVNGYTFSYQQYLVKQEVDMLLSSSTGAGIFHFMLRGTLGLSLPDGNSLHLSKGTCCLSYHPPDQSQTIQLSAGEHHYLQMALSPTLLDYLLQTLPSLPVSPGAVLMTTWFKVPPVPLPEKIKKLLAGLGLELLQSYPNLLLLNRWGIQVLSFFHAAVQRLHRQQSWETKKELKLEEIEGYINDHLDIDDRPLLKVAVLAKRLKVSPHQFYQLFSKHFGKAPAAFIRLRRLEAAMQLLSKGETPSDIYSLVGYTDLAAFTKSFTQMYGSSPRHFRQKPTQD